MEPGDQQGPPSHGRLPGYGGQPHQVPSYGQQPYQGVAQQPAYGAPPPYGQPYLPPFAQHGYGPYGQRPFVDGGARTGRVVLIALLAQLLAIAVVDNQWVADKIIRLAGRTNSVIGRGFLSSLLTYNWRFAPRGSDPAHQWAGQLLLILTTLVITALLILAVVRGPITFGRAFVGIWMAVIVATLFGAIVRGLVVDFVGFGRGGPTDLRVAQALFGTTGPSGQSFVAALLLGLFTGLIGALVATSARRPAAPAPRDERPDERGGPDVGPAVGDAAAARRTDAPSTFEQGEPTAQATTRLPVVEQGDEPPRT